MEKAKKDKQRITHAKAERLKPEKSEVVLRVTHAKEKAKKDKHAQQMKKNKTKKKNKKKNALLLSVGFGKESFLHCYFPLFFGHGCSSDINMTNILTFSIIFLV